MELAAAGVDPDKKIPQEDIITVPVQERAGAIPDEQIRRQRHAVHTLALLEEAGKQAGLEPEPALDEVEEVSEGEAEKERSSRRFTPFYPYCC